MSNNGQITIDLARLRQEGIFLMAPCYAGQCFAAFARSLMQLSSICTQHGIPFETFFIYNESLITRARNYAIDEFMRKKFKIQDADGNLTEHHFQHGIFIDSDIEFNAIDVLVMAHLQNENGYDVVAGPYPKKQIAYEKIVEAVNGGFADEDPNNLQNFIGDYVFNAANNKPIALNAPAEVREIGTGFMMIHRDTINTLREKYPELTYKPDHVRTDNFDGSREIDNFFDTMVDPETKRYLSEDYAFTKLVRDAGMKVWLIPWFQLKHHGYFIYGGSLAAMAQAGLSATVDVSKLNKNRKK